MEMRETHSISHSNSVVMVEDRNEVFPMLLLVSAADAACWQQMPQLEGHSPGKEVAASITSCFVSLIQAAAIPSYCR